MNQTNSEHQTDPTKEQKGPNLEEQVDDSQVQRKAINDENSQNNLIGEPTHKCYYERMIYEDGSQWKTERDDCEMCFCQVLCLHLSFKIYTNRYTNRYTTLFLTLYSKQGMSFGQRVWPQVFSSIGLSFFFRNILPLYFCFVEKFFV